MTKIKKISIVRICGQRSERKKERKKIGDWPAKKRREEADGKQITRGERREEGLNMPWYIQKSQGRFLREFFIGASALGGYFIACSWIQDKCRHESEQCDCGGHPISTNSVSNTIKNGPPPTLGHGIEGEIEEYTISTSYISIYLFIRTKSCTISPSFPIFTYSQPIRITIPRRELQPTCLVQST